MKPSVSVFSATIAMAFLGHANADSNYLGTCASTIVESLTSLLQNGKPSLNFGQCAKDSSGNGYSAGIVNFSTGNGDAWQVVKLYMHSSGYGGEFDAYADVIDTYASKGSGSSTSGLSGFCPAWEKAANSSNNNIFFECQDSVLSSNYFSPATTAANGLGIKFDVTKAAILDSAIVDGPGDDSSSLGGIMVAVANSINETMTGNSGNSVMIYGKYHVDEIVWLKLFLQQRKKVNPSDKPNVASYNYIVANNPYNWDSSIVALDSSGEKQTISCN
ncbi:hypothetical protein GGI23_002992 [Coemansia sp. RSA 2559]|nr:hypothetical protein GGI23_002992 [Coemansia sp. RSA 2559]KAJ2850330.1 hypothetical protein GGI22_005395 [Coemansia erecta]